MFKRVITADKKHPEIYKPIVAIGHTKDLVDFDTIDALLGYLQRNDITISTFSDIYARCQV
jgi:hypothetical protein